MTSRFPVLATVLAGVAAGSLGTLWLLPPTPYLAPTLAPAALGLSAAWTLGCLWRLDRCWEQWHRWHVSPAWVVTPAAVTRRAGALFGKGFRWEARHVETLERALLQDKGFPEGRDCRGGYPALQAVGAAEEEEVLAPSHQLTMHVGVIGMTGSGKSRLLEALLAQAIGAQDGG